MKSGLISDRVTDVTLMIADETVVLLPERALFWPRERVLFVADTHFGKLATFRAHAVPLPTGDTHDDLQRLSRALDRTQARELVILGDLLHTRQGREPQMMTAISAWRAAHHDIVITLIRGNHDAHAGDLPEDWQMTVYWQQVVRLPFVLDHKPSVSEAGYVLAGHMHPAAQLFGPARQQIKLPCFWVSAGGMVLPAFGSFIDHAIIRPLPNDQVYVSTDMSVLRV